MGFSSIGGFIIMFFALVFIISTFILIQGRMIDSTNLTFSIQKEKMETEMATDISIINISWDNSTVPATTTVYVENTGSVKLDPNQIDIFIDEIKIPRAEVNRTLGFTADSMTINPLHWDPTEVIRIDAFIALRNVTHIATVTTEYSVKDAVTYLG